MKNVIIEPITVKALLNAADVARILKVSRATVYKIFDSGAIDTIRMGSSVRCTAEALDQYIERQTIKAELSWEDRILQRVS